MRELTIHPEDLIHALPQVVWACQCGCQNSADWYGPSAYRCQYCGALTMINLDPQRRDPPEFPDGEFPNGRPYNGKDDADAWDMARERWEAEHDDGGPPPGEE